MVSPTSRASSSKRGGQRVAVAVVGHGHGAHLFGGSLQGTQVLQQLAKAILLVGQRSTYWPAGLGGQLQQGPFAQAALHGLAVTIQYKAPAGFREVSLPRPVPTPTV